MNLWEWKKKLDRVEAERNAIQWSPVPGKLFSGLVCLVAGHDIDLVGIQYGVPSPASHNFPTAMHYRCLRCQRTGVSQC
jgi:hypothetical protein